MQAEASSYREVVEFLSGTGTIVDVRSPSEYRKGHIPGAVSIPLFDDDERAKVGTLYKRQGRDPAVSAGLEIVGPKMAELADRGKAVAEHGLRVYCWRGGMRSSSMAWLFQTAGLDAVVLEGGYKAYRRQLLDDFADLPRLVVLQGNTGAGKTEILQELTELGEQVIDLEGLANHRGSAFGALGMPPQPQSQQFQNDCYAVLGDFDSQLRVWVEGESKNIGRCCMAESLWERMSTANAIELEVPLEDRVAHLVELYGGFDKVELIESVQKLSRRLGGQHVKHIVELLEQGEVTEVARGLLHYYDEGYRYSRSKHKLVKSYRLECPDGDPKRNASLILKEAERLKL